MEKLTILLIGNGAREHTLAWKVSQSSFVEEIYVIPGNGGTASVPKCQNIALEAEDFETLVSFALERNVNLVVPGPEAPLVAGIEGACREAGLRCFGPSKAAARMEGSKTFAKSFMKRHNIPTAAFESFDDYEAAKAYLDSINHSVVLKANGLAAGKGVIIPSSKQEAHEALEQIMVKKEFGSAGDEVVIEEFLEGEELSILSFCDGYTIRSLPAAQDHKQIYDGDQGPMTGGMGCYAPTTIATPDLMDKIERTILEPTIRGMRRERIPFVGLLFTGFMIDKSGEPKVLEYNVRGGDPETETLIPLLSSTTDLAEIMVACTEGWLDAVTIDVQPDYSATVIAAAGGYPGPYVRGDEITFGHQPPHTHIFHAGTTRSSNGKLKTSGGRILAATATGPTLQHALKEAYAAISTVHFDKMYYRKDIGNRHSAKPKPSLLPPRTNQSSDSSAKTNGVLPLTYSSAGVSISLGNRLVDKIKPLVASTAIPGTTASIGGFGGLFSLLDAGFSTPPLLIGAIDGVGTKLAIAHAMNKHDTVGIDLVAMNVNDLIVQGARPLFFLDCYTCGKLDVDVAASFVKGVVEGCKRAGCALVGGETAEMPGLFTGEGRAQDGGVYDAVGAAVGALDVERKVLPDKEGMKVGDVLLGLGSNGCHSNGFSLTRKIVERAGLKFIDPAPWCNQSQTGGSRGSVGEEFLAPTKIYVKSLLPSIAKNIIKGMSHITGGGLLENVPRMLPKTLAAEMDASTWDVPEVLMWLKEAGGVEDAEFARVYNTGLGMVLVVAEEHVDEAVRSMREEGETVFRVGKLVERSVGEEGVVLKGMERWRR